MALNDKQQRFVEEYMVDLNATQAAIRAGYSLTTAGSIGHEHLRKPEIAAAIEVEMKERSKRLNITADMVLQQWWDIATADPNEIIYHRKTCCRYCFGIDHHYQWKDKEEHDQAQEAENRIAAKDDRPPNIVSDEGGFGFDRTIRPHPKCPNCKGEGFSQVVIEDTRDLGHKEKLLYNGVKESRTGIEVKLRDQDKALENVARHLGMFQDNLKVSGGMINSVTINDLTPEERRARIDELERRRRIGTDPTVGG
ncbi:terminase small subunit [Paenibacillus kandeliae]|uniref:terminase small subunit n=1 Tax=Paenibacillus kandeliae TaxID=3231269 RepID=UPI0034596885